MTARLERLLLCFQAALEHIGPLGLGWPGKNAPGLLKGPLSAISEKPFLWKNWNLPAQFLKAEGSTIARDTHTTGVGNWLPHYPQGEASDCLCLLTSVYSYCAGAPGRQSPSAETWQGDLLCGLLPAPSCELQGPGPALPGCCQSSVPSSPSAEDMCDWKSFCTWPTQGGLINSFWMDSKTHLL